MPDKRLEDLISGCPARDKFERRFWMEDFPAAVPRNAPHVQIFDNYITNTRLRLRKVRVPETNQRSWFLSQKIHPMPEVFSISKDISIPLSAYEYQVLSVFEGNEVRKNRYPFEHDGRMFLFEMYLGLLWGLLMLKVRFDSEEEMSSFIAPEFAPIEISNDKMFSGPRLAELTIGEIRKRFE
jgi:CYTH domain-containing protein